MESSEDILQHLLKESSFCAVVFSPSTVAMPSSADEMPVLMSVAAALLAASNYWILFFGFFFCQSSMKPGCLRIHVLVLLEPD